MEYECSQEEGDLTYEELYHVACPLLKSIKSLGPTEISTTIANRNQYFVKYAG